MSYLSDFWCCQQVQETLRVGFRNNLNFEALKLVSWLDWSQCQVFNVGNFADPKIRETWSVTRSRIQTNSVSYSGLMLLFSRFAAPSSVICTFCFLLFQLELQNLNRNTSKVLTIFLFLRRITLPSDSQATSLIKICTIYSMTDPFPAGKNCSSFRRQVFVVNLWRSTSIKCSNAVPEFWPSCLGINKEMVLHWICNVFVIFRIYLRFLDLRPWSSGLFRQQIRLVFFLGLVLGQ